jgi:hypothetical protein
LPTRSFSWTPERGQVAPGFTGLELDAVVAPEHLESLGLDQRELAPHLRVVPVARVVRVAIADQTDSHHRFDLVHRLRRRPLRRGDVDVLYVSHAANDDGA